MDKKSKEQREIISKNSTGESNGNAKLREVDVIEIKKQIQLNVSVKDIADKYGVNPATIRAIGSGRLWKHVVPGTDFKL